MLVQRCSAATAPLVRASSRTFTVERMARMTFASYRAALVRRDLQVTGEDVAG
jgi:hypothetical protein